MTLEQLYNKANELGETLELQFWIHRPGYGPHDRVCGEVLIYDHDDIVVCSQPWGTYHDHASREN